MNSSTTSPNRRPEAQVPGAPLLERLVTLAFGLGELPAHFSKGNGVDPYNLDDRDLSQIVIDEREVLAHDFELLSSRT